jgi:putative N6-adenine-specific DNA methylase
LDLQIKNVVPANYRLRTALKILVPLSEAEVKDENDLYNYIRSIRWDKYMQVQDTLAVDVAMKTNIFRHTQFIAQRVKDAIVDQFRDKYGTRPSVDLDRPTLRINVYISDRTIKLSCDSSGDSLHRRGYRVKQGPAPMNEVLAAGLIRLSGWNGSDPLVDFMCGSGTIAIEAALSACCIPPGDLRKDYGFQKWKDYDPKLFYDIVNENKKAGDVQRILVYASDIDPETVKLAMRHAQNAGVSKLIDFQTCHFKDLPPMPRVSLLLTSTGKELYSKIWNELYTQLGDRLKSAYAGYDAWIISANAEAVNTLVCGHPGRLRYLTTAGVPL